MAKKPAPSASAPQTSNDAAMTPARFEKELRDLKHKAESRSPLQDSIACTTPIISMALSRLFGKDLVKLLPVIAIWIPALQFIISDESASLGAEWGPTIVESVTLLPLIIISVAEVALSLEGMSIRLLPGWIGDSLPGLLGLLFFKTVESVSSMRIPMFLGSSALASRVGLQLAFAAVYTLYAPSQFLLLGLPAVAHAALFNTHLPTAAATAALQASLEEEAWKLIARKESVTGYVSVLESVERGFRVMRFFVMLEAVRLILTKETIMDSTANALVIGLGIGTTPGAFIAHGINTTIVEIDPAVHEFAVDYFGLSTNHIPIIEDAVSYTSALAKTNPESFDYIVHDVFTGGAEPVPLFTLEFLQGLKDLLKPDGVIAINYAGDFLLPPTKAVVKTIRSIFPSCRIFREIERQSDEEIKDQNQDFANMVIFCRKSSEPIDFRPATDDDFLGTGTRKLTLQPRYEVKEEEFKAIGETGLVTRNDTSELEMHRDSSALGHWTIMRTVLPSFVWEQW
ncbi:Methyltransferase-like protein 13 [Ceratocystis platani]|uniref:Methyltransferase-like protein 13 n=1 Tax=Ceratocystis fimbriata f. sp. platani TaxID=88771 RepID=A0A0F8CTK1_CERFI|nr:Methyltransferase-like protein 13 [Ceratocystis platani]